MRPRHAPRTRFQTAARAVQQAWGHERLLIEHHARLFHHQRLILATLTRALRAAILTRHPDQENHPCSPPAPAVTASSETT